MHKAYMRRCFDLALKGIIDTKSNPMVGAVLVHNETIIGEGYHQKYGEAHAEVNCFASVEEANRPLIKASTLYVSLEPCCHYGKTPPCVELIKSHQVKKVVFSVLDVNEKTKGKSIAILEEAGIEVEHGILKDEGEAILHKFRVNHLEKKAFVTLKWANSMEGYAGLQDQSVWYSNIYSKHYAHRLRAKSEGILIGSNTVLVDNPTLSNRLSWGNNPYLVILDRNQRIPVQHDIFQQDRKIILFNTKKNNLVYPENVSVHPIQDFNLNKIPEILFRDYNITSVLIEGGPRIHKQFVLENLWDDAYVIHTNKKQTSGIKAPVIQGKLNDKLMLLNDRISHIVNVNK